MKTLVARITKLDRVTGKRSWRYQWPKVKGGRPTAALIAALRGTCATKEGAEDAIERRFAAWLQAAREELEEARYTPERAARPHTPARLGMHLAGWPLLITYGLAPTLSRACARASPWRAWVPLC